MGDLKYDEAKVIELIAKHKGNVSTIAKSLGCSRSTILSYANNNPTIAQALKDAREEMTDIAESKLLLAIKRGDAWAVCFYLKTQGKSRGYIERQEVTGADGESLRPVIYLPSVDDSSDGS